MKLFPKNAKQNKKKKEIKKENYFMMCFFNSFRKFLCFFNSFRKFLCFFNSFRKFHFFPFFAEYWQVRFCSFLAYKGRTYVFLFIFLAVSEKTKMGFVFKNSVLFFRKPSRADAFRVLAARLGFREEKKLIFKNKSHLKMVFHRTGMGPDFFLFRSPLPL